MFRGYKCVNKDAKTILKVLGFDSKVNRGWVLLREGWASEDTPVQMHALINVDNDGTEYIDIHADFMIENQHVTKRGERTKRWNQIFKQVDFDEQCDAGHKLFANYVGLKKAITNYHETLERSQRGQRQEVS